MLTWETTVEAQALYARGWTKSAIARHLGINRRTVRAYLKGQQVPGQRVRSEPEVFAPFAEYARLRLADDPHLWASTLFDELTALGYAGSYPSFTRALRMRRLRPHCEPCAASRGRDAGLWAEDRVTAARDAARIITQAPAATWEREIAAVAGDTGLDVALLRTAV